MTVAGCRALFSLFLFSGGSFCDGNGGFGCGGGGGGGGGCGGCGGGGGLFYWLSLPGGDRFRLPRLLFSVFAA